MSVQGHHNGNVLSNTYSEKGHFPLDLHVMKSSLPNLCNVPKHQKRSLNLSKCIYLIVIWLLSWWEALKAARDPRTHRPFWPCGICDTAMSHWMHDLSRLKIRLYFKIGSVFQRKVSCRIPAQMPSLSFPPSLLFSMRPDLLYLSKHISMLFANEISNTNWNYKINVVFIVVKCLWFGAFINKMEWGKK